MELDLQDKGIDLGDGDLMARRSWDWLRLRVEGLLIAPPMFMEGTAVPTTRLGWELTPPATS